MSLLRENLSQPLWLFLLKSRFPTQPSVSVRRLNLDRLTAMIYGWDRHFLFTSSERNLGDKPWFLCLDSPTLPPAGSQCFRLFQTARQFNYLIKSAKLFLKFVCQSHISVDCRQFGSFYGFVLLLQVRTPKFEAFLGHKMNSDELETWFRLAVTSLTG